MSNRRPQKPKAVTGTGNRTRVERVQGIRRSNAAGIHSVNRPRSRISVRDAMVIVDQHYAEEYEDLTNGFDE